MWRAGPLVAEDYLFLKPEPANMGRSMARQMIDQMPH
jgi:hypothetical protein